MTTDQLERKKARIVLDIEDLVEEIRDVEVQDSLKKIAQDLHRTRMPWQE